LQANFSHNAVLFFQLDSAIARQGVIQLKSSTKNISSGSLNYPEAS